MTIANISEILSCFPKELKLIKELVYDKCGFDFSDFKLAAESKKYSACSFRLNGKEIQQRASKITPTKIGQFVSIWKRNKEGITTPFDSSDDLDFIVITARSVDNYGQFIFPKSALVTNGVISQNSIGGKRGIRVYPPWDIATNQQAGKTQIWQLKYFLTIQSDQVVDLNLAKQLFLQI